MANPSPQAVTAIRNRVAALGLAWTSLTDAQVLADLQADTVANPTPQATVPKVFAARDTLSILGVASVASLLALPAFDPTIRTLLNVTGKTAAEVANLNDWAGALFKGGKLTQTEFDQLAAPAPGTTAGAATGLFNQTQPDPAWPAVLPRIQLTLGRPIDQADVTASRP